MRICLSINGNPGQARRASNRQLFIKDIFGKTLSDASKYKKYFFGFKAYEYLNEIQKSSKETLTINLDKLNMAMDCAMAKLQ